MYIPEQGEERRPFSIKLDLRPFDGEQQKKKSATKNNQYVCFVFVSSQRKRSSPSRLRSI